MITVDYHNHHVRCGHATGTIEDYIKFALQKGLTEIGISDHAPMYWLEGNDPQPRGAMAKDELDGYVEETLKLKAKYADQIAVKLGIEADYIEGMEQDYAAILAKYPFDYVIGSVHLVNNVHVYEASRWQNRPNATPIFEEYYRLVVKSAQSGLFDILAHTSAVLAYAPQPFPAETATMQDAALDAIKQSGITVEINTSGYRKMNTDPFPTTRMVRRAAALGIPLTFSSDSHHPEQVANNRDKVELLLLELGVNELSSFTARQRSAVPMANIINV